MINRNMDYEGPPESILKLFGTKNEQTLLSQEIRLMDTIHSWLYPFLRRWLGMNQEAKNLKAVLKQNVNASLTHQLLNIPAGGKVVTLSNGQQVKVTASVSSSTQHKK